MDMVLLSRIQFAFTIAFHIIFPAFSIGLATFLVIMETVWLKTKNPLYLNLCQFWTKIFALTFGMGVVSGVVMEFQLGANWSSYTDMVGSALGGLFTYEVLTAFFIEAGFLGIMVLGWERVGHKLHYLSTLLVVIGVTLSAFWILSANSWMQYPAGATLTNGRFVVTDWFKVIFNPTAIPRYLHMLLSAYITTGWVIAGVSAHYLLKNQHIDIAKRCLSFVIIALIILVPIQVFLGDKVGLNIHRYQPLKTAAIEGLWETEKGAPLLLVAIPDPKTQHNRFEIGIPHFASVINTHHWNGELQGLKTAPVEDQPWVAGVFYSFRIMVGIGVLMLLVAIIGVILKIRRQLYETTWFLKVCRIFSPAGFIAILTGWFTAELGRQPWVVQNYLKTRDAASAVSLHNVIISLVLIVIVYGIIFGIFYFRYLTKIIRQGPAANLPVENPPFSYMESPNIVKEPE